ncbi:MAG: hypothetical protein D6798_11705 [Deltaproteobacteria bacterium]|nr:MAG: hypothetical protein D6798_11705 [Deltaproteobacteria bacterium]
MRTRWLLLLLAPATAYLLWWVGHDPLPDGYQNEYLLIGNAWDLWQALVQGDTWHLRWYAYTGYWPFGLYVVPWPFMALLGPTRLALLLGNLVHLAVLLWATNDLGRRLAALLAAPLLLLTPAVFGTLVRFEPNLAAMAWTTLGLSMLARSEGLRRRWPVIGYGCALGIGLMMDRLTVAFFLLPALLPPLWVAWRRAPRQALGRLGLALFTALLWCGAYYREFFLRHADELLSQAPVGEIDSAGHVTATEGPLALLYYPLALVDSQAGPIVGVLMLGGLVAAILRQRHRRDITERILLASIIGSLVFFTLVAKKQVFYTLPMVPALAVLAARWRWGALVGLAGGVWNLLAVGIGAVPGGPWLPEAWVAPRHVLARPPTHQHWPLRPAIEALDGATHVAVLSEDPTLFEGFVILAVREALPEIPVRGVVLDPAGTYEHIDAIDALVWVGPRGGAFPTTEGIRAQLVEDNLDPADYPPVGDVLVEAAPRFVEVGRWPMEGGAGDMDLVVFRRR